VFDLTLADSDIAPSIERLLGGLETAEPNLFDYTNAVRHGTLLAACVGTGEGFYPRLSMGSRELARGFPIAAAVLGVLIIRAVLKGLEEIWWAKQKVTLTAIYVQETRIEAAWFAIAFGVLGYLMRLLAISPLPFVIAFILAGNLESIARQAYAATGGDAFFRIDLSKAFQLNI